MAERGLLGIRKGKGNKDRVVPIGQKSTILDQGLS